MPWQAVTGENEKRWKILGDVTNSWGNILILWQPKMLVLRKKRKETLQTLLSNDMTFRDKLASDTQSVKGNNNIPGGASLGPNGILLWVVSCHGIQL